MSEAVQPCPPDPCGDLLQEILEFIEEIQRRYWDLRNDIGNLPETPPAEPHPRYGTRSKQGERHQFNGRQQGLRNRLNEFQENGCGPPPAVAWDWATREAPQADPKPGPDAARIAAGAAGAAAVVGTGYLIYRVIRMIPSVAIPALWPTIPANAAIP